MSEKTPESTESSPTAVEPIEDTQSFALELERAAYRLRIAVQCREVAKTELEEATTALTDAQECVVARQEDFKRLTDKFAAHIATGESATL